MFAGKPIIGLAGGIGSGKSHVADILGKLHCLVISSDELVRQAYELPQVRDTLTQWWGSGILDAQGEVSRQSVAKKVFADPRERRRLEDLLHPLVGEQRRQIMASHRDNAHIAAYVWDVPLLFETGLNRQCDAVIFVDAPDEERDNRLAQTRGWTRDERIRREKLQLSLDKKREMSDYVVRNAREADPLIEQVQSVFRLILA